VPAAVPAGIVTVSPPVSDAPVPSAGTRARSKQHVARIHRVVHREVVTRVRRRGDASAQVPRRVAHRDDGPRADSRRKRQARDLQVRPTRIVRAYVLLVSEVSPTTLPLSAIAKKSQNVPTGVPPGMVTVTDPVSEAPASQRGHSATAEHDVGRIEHTVVRRQVVGRGRRGSAAALVPRRIGDGEGKPRARIRRRRQGRDDQIGAHRDVRARDVVGLVRLHQRVVAVGLREQEVQAGAWLPAGMVSVTAPVSDAPGANAATARAPSSTSEASSTEFAER